MEIKNGNIYISKVSGTLVVAKCNDNKTSYSDLFSGYELMDKDLINNWTKSNFTEYHIDDVKSNENTPSGEITKEDYVLKDNQEYNIPEGYDVVVKNNKVNIVKKVRYYKTCVDQDFFYNLSVMVYDGGYVLMRSDLDNECKNANIIYLKTSNNSFSDDVELSKYEWEKSSRDYFKSIYDLSFKENSLPEKILKIINNEK